MRAFALKAKTRPKGYEPCKAKPLCEKVLKICYRVDTPKYTPTFCRLRFFSFFCSLDILADLIIPSAIILPAATNSPRHSYLANSIIGRSQPGVQSGQLCPVDKLLLGRRYNRAKKAFWVTALLLGSLFSGCNNKLLQGSVFSVCWFAAFSFCFLSLSASTASAAVDNLKEVAPEITKATYVLFVLKTSAAFWVTRSGFFGSTLSIN